MNTSMIRSAVLLSVLILARSVYGTGADIPWKTYEAEDMKTTGVVMGPNYGPLQVEAESCGQKCVKLRAKGYVEFTAKDDANTLVVRYSLPDSSKGGGIDSTLSLYKNGEFLKKIPVTSKLSWIYGNYPFSGGPDQGVPRNFYDETHLKDIPIKAGDVLRIEKDSDSARYCIIDLVDLEQIAPALSAPANSLSIMDFGASGKGDSDDTQALIKCVAAAGQQGKTVWVPPGDYKLSADINLASNTTIQGAGMWYTTFVGDPAVYKDKARRVRFVGAGSNLHLADFAILGKLNFRNDEEPNDGIFGPFGDNSTVSRIWGEHTKVGMWMVNSSNLVVDSCRFRDTLADGINFCVGMRNSTIQNCTTRGTGDDCFAIWPATYQEQTYTPGHNVVKHCTGVCPFLANGCAIYGGDSNRVEDSKFVDDLAGCGILISTTFPTANDYFDNNFTGTTVVENCDVIRCGGFDLWRSWRAAVQLCVDTRNISGVLIRNVNIRDSIADGFSVVASDGEHGNKTLFNAVLENVTIPNHGIGVNGRHGFWVRDDAYGSLTIKNSKITDLQNDSAHLTIENP